MKGFVKNTRPRPGSFLLLSVLFEIAYWLLILVAGWVLFYRGFIRFILILPILPFLLPLGPIAFLLILVFYAVVESCGRLRLRFRVDAARALERENRAPILYLRSFHYENFDKNLGARAEKNSFFENENDDEVLALALKEVGPLLAVGRPGDRVPPLGSIRLYFEDGEWQQRVTELIRISRLVVIQPGYTDGLEEEIKMAKKLPPEKVLYSFLAWQHRGRRSKDIEYDTFSMQVKRIYGCSLPEEIGNTYFLHFTKSQRDGEGDWRPHLIGLKGWKRFFFRICSSPNVILRLLNSELVSFVIARLSPVAALLRRLPVPRAFRAYSVPGVREALRPVMTAADVGLPVWRTAFFVTAVVISICALLATNLYLFSS